MEVIKNALKFLLDGMHLEDIGLKSYLPVMQLQWTEMKS